MHRRDLLDIVPFVFALGVLLMGVSPAVGQTHDTGEPGDERPQSSPPDTEKDEFTASADLPVTAPGRILHRLGALGGMIGGGVSLGAFSFFLSSSLIRSAGDNVGEVEMFGRTHPRPARTIGAVGIASGAIVGSGIGAKLAGDALGGRGELGPSLLGSAVGGALIPGALVGTGALIAQLDRGVISGPALLLAGLGVAIAPAGSMLGSVIGYRKSHRAQSNDDEITLRPTVTPSVAVGPAGGRLGFSIRY